MAQIKKENAIKAWKEGCEDVRKVLENLFPDIDFTVSHLKFKKDAKFNSIIKIVDLDFEPDTNLPYQIEIGGTGESKTEAEITWITADQMQALADNQ